MYAIASAKLHTRLIESSFCVGYTIRQLEEPEFIEQHIESIAGDDVDLVVDPEVGNPFDSLVDDDISEIRECLRNIAWLEASPSEIGNPFVQPNQELVDHFAAVRNELLHGTELSDSPTFARLQVLLPAVDSDLLVAVIWQLTERRDLRVGMLFPSDQSYQFWVRMNQSDQSTVISPQVMGHSRKTRDPYKCWKCGEPMKLHSCLLPMNGPGRINGYDGKEWIIRRAEDVWKEMANAAKENGARMSPAEKQLDTDMPKKRGSYRCGMCGKKKKSKRHSCIKKCKTTLGADGKTLYCATPAGSASDSKVVSYSSFQSPSCSRYNLRLQTRNRTRMGWVTTR